jgi:predicted DNA-binding antitoxin AbrB/MazE fold protein
MEKTIQAVYEGGALHPLEPLLLQERQRVTVTISDAEIPGEHPLLVSSDEWADAAQHDIALEEVRRQLAGVRGTLSEAIIQERRDR